MLIAGDHPAYRRGLWLTLSRAEDLGIVAEADTGLRAVALAEQVHSDVVVMDRACLTWTGSQRHVD